MLLVKRGGITRLCIAIATTLAVQIFFMPASVEMCAAPKGSGLVFGFDKERATDFPERQDIATVTTDFFGREDIAHAVAIQADGKIVVAGFAAHAVNRSSADFAVARYNSDLTLDATFGVGGKVTTDFAGRDDEAYAVVIDSNGRILVAGSTFSFVDGSNFGLARYNPDGSLDASFGNSGKVISDFSSRFDRAADLAIQNDGKIVVAGGGGPVFICFVLARYNTDGSFDTSFGDNGFVWTLFPQNSEASKVVILPSGKIFAGGRITQSAGALARYDHDGTLDTSFGVDGRVITAGADLYDFAIQQDEKVIASGIIGNHLALLRYLPDGTLDPSFGSGGTVIDDIIDDARSVAIEPDGKIVVAGAANGFTAFGLARYQVDGQLDRSFGNGGKITTIFKGFLENPNQIAFRPDGSLISVGRAFVKTKSDFAIVRYHGDLFRF